MPDTDTTIYARWIIKDLNTGGNNPKYKNSTKWARGIVPPEEADSHVWSETKEINWEPYYGFYDVFQGELPLCWAASGSNMLEYWMLQNREYLDDYNLTLPTGFINSGGRKGYDSHLFSEMKDTFKNSKPYGGRQIWALSWFFNGWQDQYPNTGAYLKSLNLNVNDYAETVVSNTKLFNDSINYIIENGGAIGIAFANHAFTIFGASFDDQGYVDGVYITNSNDNDVFRHSAIYYKKVYYIDGKPTVINGSGQYDSLANFTILKVNNDSWEEMVRNKTKSIIEPTYNEPTESYSSQETTVSSQEQIKSALSSGVTKIKLSANINVDSTIEINKDVTILYNGHKITGFRGGPVFRVKGDNHNISFVGNSSNNSNEGIFDGNGMILSSGAIEISGNNNKVLIKNGTYSNNSGRNGGAIYMNSKGGSLLIDGAKINNNRSVSSNYGRGGAIYVEKGTAKVKSGELKNNSSDYVGGAVAVNANAKFILAGGEISNNSVNYDVGNQDGGGGAIAALRHGAFIELAGGNITNNSVRGEHAYGGAIKDALNSITISGNVNISNNQDKTRKTTSNIALEYKKFKNDDSAISKIKYKNNASAITASNKIGVHYIKQGTGLFVDKTTTGSISLPSLFTSDNSKYQITTDGHIQAREDDYEIVVKNDTNAITYGSSGQYRISLYKNGDKQNDQDVKLIFKGREIAPYWDDNEAVFVISPIGQKLDMKLGDNEFELVWKDNAKIIRKNINITFSPAIIENNEIIWQDYQIRKEGDGKYVKAEITSSSIYNNDEGKVFIKVNNARNQKAGKYTAYIAGIGGEKAKYYRLASGIPDEYWQKTYTINKDSQAIVIEGSPKEKSILMGESYTYKFQISQNDTPLTTGKIQILYKGNVLKEQPLDVEGKAEILFDRSSYLGYGDHNLTIKYVSNDGSKTQSTDWLLSVNKNGLKQLYFDGSLSAKSDYGVSFSDLAITSNGTVKDAQNNVVEGNWKWVVEDFLEKPTPSSKKTYKAIFIPKKTGVYKDLVTDVSVNIQKAKQIGSAFIDIEYFTKNSIKVNDYLSKNGTETLYSLDGTKWQPSSLFADLNPGQQYTVYMKYGGNDKYFDSKVSEGKRVTLFSPSSGSNTLNIEANPTASASYGTELKDIFISGGLVKNNGSIVQGKWQWDANQDLTTLHEKPSVGGSKQYKAIFVPNNHDKELGVISATITPTISKATQNQLLRITLSSVSKTSIHLNQITSPNGTKVQYKVNNGSWQDSPNFDNLSPDTNYVFKAKFLGNDSYYESPETSATYSTDSTDDNKNATYSISLEHKNDHVVYGQDVSVSVIVKNDKTHQNATNGKVRMFRDSTFICEADVIDGKAVLTYNTAGKIITAFKKGYDGAGQYIRIVYTSSGNKSVVLFDNLIVYKKELSVEWKNNKVRYENDNKKVKARPNNLVGTDDLRLYVDNGNEQSSGVYTARAYINDSKDLETPWYVLDSSKSFTDYTIKPASEKPQGYVDENDDDSDSWEYTNTYSNSNENSNDNSWSNNYDNSVDSNNSDSSTSSNSSDNSVDSNESRNNETTNRPVNNKPKLTGISWIDVMVVKPDCDMNNSDLKLPNELKVWTDSAGSINLPVNWDLNNITSSDKEVDGQKFKNLSINGHIILNDKIDQNDVSLNVTAERLVPQFDKSKKDVELNVVVPDPENTNKATILINKPKNYKIYYSIGDQTPTVDSPLYTEPTEIVNDSTEDKTITIKYLIVDEETNKAVEKSYSFVLKGNTTIDDKPETNNKSNLTTILAATIPTVGAVGIIGAIAYFFSRRKKRMTR
ncbi:hypothetical protein [Mycoplasma bradburyae]|uniref:hypothetical protein n=1 Tax=Mycoplasma bradburyae TaxID=2963128 RepID=UPI0020CF4086|nr:hypothetical protein [Mycoplasma bradburyae]UTS71082.1 hypothetical protein NMG77_01290 [Mycoplasma bradburyae]